MENGEIDYKFLVKRAIRLLPRTHVGRTTSIAVSSLFGITHSAAVRLCEDLGFNPESIIGSHAG